MASASTDPGRRAWGFACPYCGPADCATCAARSTCRDHWAYYLGGPSPREAELECPQCALRWVVDTRCGAGGRPAMPELEFPVPRHVLDDMFDAEAG